MTTKRLQMSTSAVSVMLKSATACPCWYFTVSFFKNISEIIKVMRNLVVQTVSSTCRSMQNLKVQFYVHTTKHLNCNDDHRTNGNVPLHGNVEQSLLWMKHWCFVSECCVELHIGMVYLSYESIVWTDSLHWTYDEVGFSALAHSSHLHQPHSKLRSRRQKWSKSHSPWLDWRYTEPQLHSSWYFSQYYLRCTQCTAWCEGSHAPHLIYCSLRVMHQTHCSFQSKEHSTLYGW